MDVPRARPPPSSEGQCELDSHADTTATRSNMILIEDQVVSHVDVHPFLPELEPIKNIPIGTCVSAYTAPDGKVWLIYFHEALYFGDKLSHSLICPNQIRDCHPNRVDEAPRQYDHKSSHSIHIDNTDPEDPGAGHTLDIKLMLDGVVSYFPSRKPTKHEMATCDHVVATHDFPWDPKSKKFEQAKEAIDGSHPLNPTVSVLHAETPIASAPTKKSKKSNKRKLEPVETRSNFSPHLYDKPLRSDELILPQHDCYEKYKLRSLQQLCTRRDLTPCAIASDSRLDARLSSLYSGDSLKTCGDDDVDEDAAVPSLTINALHTPLYERAYTNGCERFELDPRCRESDFSPVCLSSVYKHVQWDDDAVEPVDPELDTISRRAKWGPTIDTERYCKIDSDRLSKIWDVSPRKAADTLRVTTQKGFRNPLHPLVRRLPTQSFRNKRIAAGKWYTNTWMAKVPSIMRQDSAAQVFSNGKGYDEFIPIQGKKQAYEGLKIFIHDVGIPEHLISDGAREQGAPGTYNI